MKLAQKIAINYFRAKLILIAVFSNRRAAESAMKILFTPYRKSGGKLSPVFEKGESLSFDLEGTIIRGYRWNAGGYKRVLIIHGFESSSKNFDRYIIQLIASGCEVLAFDAPAHGRSGGREVNLLTYISMLRHVHDHYGPFAGYLSHSFGGLAVTHFLEQVPHDEKVQLVLIAPATESTSAIDSFFRVLQLPDSIRKEFDKLILTRSGVPPEHFSIRRAMRNIRATTLWFHDENDDLTPIHDALLVKEDGHPHLDFVITRGLGHKKIYRDNKVVQRCVAALAGSVRS